MSNRITNNSVAIDSVRLNANNTCLFTGRSFTWSACSVEFNDNIRLPEFGGVVPNIVQSLAAVQGWLLVGK